MAIVGNIRLLYSPGATPPHTRQRRPAVTIAGAVSSVTVRHYRLRGFPETSGFGNLFQGHTKFQTEPG
jgi:hypothetical protein